MRSGGIIEDPADILLTDDFEVTQGQQKRFDSAASPDATPVASVKLAISWHPLYNGRRKRR